MRTWNVSRKLALLVITSFWLMGCFKNPGDEKSPTTSSIPIAPVYLTDTTSYLLLSGPCGGNTTVTVNYSSELTVGSTLDVKCTNDQVSYQLPVTRGLVTQTFNVYLTGQIRNKKAKTLKIVVNYTPPNLNPPGFAVLSGGGAIDSVPGDMNSFISIGEVPAKRLGMTTANQITDPVVPENIPGDMKLRPGLNGILDP